MKPSKSHTHIQIEFEVAEQHNVVPTHIDLVDVETQDSQEPAVQATCAEQNTNNGKPHKKTSKVWNCFELLPVCADGKARAKCRVPLLKAMYGPGAVNLVVQASIVQAIIWLTILLFVLELPKDVEGNNQSMVTNSPRTSFWSLMKIVWYCG
ncbi:hypothetical protein IFM89_008144 [Coptis chinensis]|uniref:Uncharacterized protein n=1 Tax=Coptis chinensis TaxID=261450 RepID=A0A835MHS2_9MAGN|nr:hypothetical protein IFM89_008144 [Coptis chinensis]